MRLSPWFHRFRWMLGPALCLFVFGCSGESEPPETPAPAPAPAASTQESEPSEAPTPPPSTPDADDLDEKLASVRRQLIIDRGSLEAESQNEGNGLSAIEKHELTFKGLHVLERIPESVDEEGLRIQLEGHCTDFGFVCALEEVSAVAVEDRKIPDTLVGPAKVVYKDDQVRGRVVLRIAITPIKIDRMQKWMANMPRNMARLIHIKKAYARDKKMIVEADAYWYLPVVFPEHEPEIRTLENYLKDAGIDASLETVKKEARPRRWAEIERLHQEMEGFRVAATRTLTLYAKGNAIGARWSFFRKRTELIEKTSFLDIFQ